MDKQGYYKISAILIGIGLAVAGAFTQFDWKGAVCGGAAPAQAELSK